MVKDSRYAPNSEKHVRTPQALGEQQKHNRRSVSTKPFFTHAKHSGEGWQCNALPAHNQAQQHTQQQQQQLCLPGVYERSKRVCVWKRVLNRKTSRQAHNNSREDAITADVAACSGHTYSPAALVVGAQEPRLLPLLRGSSMMTQLPVRGRRPARELQQPSWKARGAFLMTA